MRRFISAFLALVLTVAPAWAAIDFPTSPTTGQTYAYSGQTYIYNGSAWNTLTLGTSPAITKQVFTSSGTYTPSSGMQYAIIECVGSGASGGGAANSTAWGEGGGGGGGSYSRAYVTAAQVGASQTVTVGNAGTPGTAGNNPGNNGSDVSVGTLCVGKGGSAGGGTAANGGGAGGAGGVAGTGDVTVPGKAGEDGGFSTTAGLAGVTGSGGSSGLGWGAGGKTAGGTTGTDGSLYGGGGGGGGSFSSGGNKAGGAGAKGIVVITEFLASSWGASVLATNPGSGIYNVGFSLSANASALTIALKTASGADPTTGTPVIIPFNDATGTSTSPASHTLQVTAATSLVVSSGSTLGVTSSKAFRLWIEGCDDSGTFRLGVFNASDATHIYPLAEEQTQTSTAEGGAGAADSAGVLYTGTAVSSKSCRILGYAEWSSSGLTAGTWTTTNLTNVRVFGPGVHKPGDIVQSVATTSSPSDTTTSATFVVTSVAPSITPTSAANLIKATMVGTGYNASAAGNSGFQISRGNTNNTNMIGSLTQCLSSGGSNQQSVTAIALDKPNTTSSQIYALQFRETGGTAGYGAGTATYQILEEIMG